MCVCRVRDVVNESSKPRSFGGSEGQRSGLRGTKTVPGRFLYFCECWLLLIVSPIRFLSSTMTITITKTTRLKLYEIRTKDYKNSSGDEIANVNFLTTISHTRRPTSKYRKRDKPTVR